MSDAREPDTEAPAPRPSEFPDRSETTPSLARFSVRQPVLVNLLALAMMVAGGYVLSGMTREVYPVVPVGAAGITTLMPGASAEEVEQLITSPIEDELADIEDIDVITSTSRDGYSFVWIEFDASVTDTGRKVMEVTNEVNRVSTLPEGAEDPVVREFAVRPPMLSIAVRGDAPEPVLRAVARELEDRGTRLPGVSRLVQTGIREREIHVEVDPDRLDGHRVSLAQVASALTTRGSNVPAGQMEGGRRSRIVRGMAEASSREAIEDVVVAAHPGGGPVRVRDVAHVESGFERARTLSRVNGEPAIVFLLQKEDGGDAIRISHDVHALLEQMRPGLPAGVTLTVFGDTAPWVTNNLGTLYANAAMGLVLVLLILWRFVGFRNGLMAALGIPVALAGGIVVMHLLGITINLLSLLALTLSLGVIVDDAIIIIENVFRHVEAGMPRRRAAIHGTMEVFWPVVSSTMTTCSAFLPLLLMVGVLGKFFAIIPKVIVAALIASLIEAFFVLPSHLADFGATAPKPTDEKPRFAGLRTNLERRFTAALRLALRHRFLVIGGAYVLCSALIASAFTFKSVTLLTDGEAESFDIRIRMPTDTSPEETDRVLREIERRMLAVDEPDVQAVINTRGYSRTRTWQVTGDHVGMVTVNMLPPGERRALDSGTRLMERAEHMFDDLVGPASIELVKHEEGPPRGAPVAVEMTGDDLSELADLSERVQAELRQIRGVRDVTDDYELGKRELRVAVDEERAAMHGLSTQSVTRWLSLVFGAAPVTTTRDGDEEVDVVVRLDESARDDPERLAELTLLTPTGQTVALREIADLIPDRGISAIRHTDRHRSVTVTCELVEGSGATSTDVNNELAERLAPLMAANPRIGFSLGGEFEETEESVSSLFLAFLVAALLIYTILATQFRSFLQPMVVMTAIPLSLLGVSVGFLVTPGAVGLIGLIGVVGLAGIVVNDSLVLVDFINKRREEGIEVNEAIVDAARLRLRPIFLTSVTTIAGLFPLALGIGGRSQLLAPMATAISWGLTFSTILILVVVPCLYSVVDSGSNRMGKLTAGLRRVLTGDEPEASSTADPAE